MKIITIALSCFVCFPAFAGVDGPVNGHSNQNVNQNVTTYTPSNSNSQSISKSASKASAFNKINSQTNSKVNSTNDSNANVSGDNTHAFGFAYAAPSLSTTNSGISSTDETIVTLPNFVQFPIVGGGFGNTEVFPTPGVGAINLINLSVNARNEDNPQIAYATTAYLCTYFEKFARKAGHNCKD